MQIMSIWRDVGDEKKITQIELDSIKKSVKFKVDSRKT